MLSTAPLVRVQLVAERAIAYDTAIKGPTTMASAVYELLKDSDREQFVALHLDTKHQVLSMEVVAVGTLNATLVHPREVFKGAILANAACVCLAHNHPSGDVTPSPEDLALTKHLIQAGDILGIHVLDHLIVGPRSTHFVSIRELHSEYGWT